MSKVSKPAQKAPRSGEYQIIGPHGGSGSRRRASSHVKGDVLITKSGRTIMVSPARTTRTSVESWSKAFKK